MTLDESIRPIVSWGELLWDLFPDGPRLGGCAANVAFHVAGLGERSVLVSRVGDDELGRRATSALTRRGVEVDAVEVDRELPTGTVEVEIVDGEPKYRLGSNPAWDRIDVNAEARRALSVCAVLVYGTLAQRTSLGSGALRNAFRIVPQDCIRVCDVNIRGSHSTSDVVEGSLLEAHAVKINEREYDHLRQLFGIRIDVCDWLVRERGVGCVAFTRGARGSILVTRDARVEHDGVTAPKGGDAVGAGDAFTAVLAAHLARGSSLNFVSEAANHYAAHVAGRPGATPDVPRELVDRVAPRRRS